MADMTTYERLLRELEDDRWFRMGQLADAAEEGGDPALARGWRYMAEEKRWPESTFQDTGPGGWGACYEWRASYPGPHRWSDASDPYFETRLPAAAVARMIENYGGLPFGDFAAGWNPCVYRPDGQWFGCDDLVWLLEFTARCIGEWLEGGGGKV